MVLEKACVDEFGNQGEKKRITARGSKTFQGQMHINGIIEQRMWESRNG